MDAYSRATELLTTHKKQLLDIADALLAREVLDADQVQKLARGEALEDPPPRGPDGHAPTKRRATAPATRNVRRSCRRMPKPLTQE